MLKELEMQLEREREILFKGGFDAVKLIISKLSRTRDDLKEKLPYIKDGEESSQMKIAYKILLDIERIIENWTNAGIPENKKSSFKIDKQ